MDSFGTTIFVVTPITGEQFIVMQMIQGIFKFGQCSMFLVETANEWSQVVLIPGEGIALNR